jgi:O-antigen/teichoic acid export membrane protein
MADMTAGRQIPPRRGRERHRPAAGPRRGGEAPAGAHGDGCVAAPAAGDASPAAHGDGGLAAPPAGDGTLEAPARPARRHARDQALVALGQVAAGGGNLVFSLVAARLLAPAGFAELAAFLALFLVVHVPAGSLSAGSALVPRVALLQRGRALRAGAGLGAAVALAAVPVAGLAGLPVALLLVLAAGIPVAGLLALERGRLYGTHAHGRAIASLVAEPAVRLAAGIPLALAAGAAGAAAGVVLGSYAALLATAPWRARDTDGPYDATSAARSDLAAPGSPTSDPADPAGDLSIAGESDLAAPGSATTDPADPASAPAAGRSAGRSAAAGAVGAFLLLALVQNQDVLLANASLPSGEAARFAVLSTLGGIAAFATTTVPLMLLPRAAAGERGALRAALLVAAGLGAGAMLAVGVAPSLIVGTIFGGRYAAVGPLAVAYLGAMALLGIARVLVAHACAVGRGRGVTIALALAAAAQTAGILAFGHDAAAVAHVTLAATALLAASTGGLAVVRRLPVGDALAARGRDRRIRLRRPSPTALAVGGLTLAALIVRLVTTRGIWLDEATSISQAQRPYGVMLHSLQTTDVHPPLHHTVLWLIVHLTGSTSELAMRLPSMLAGTLLVPVLYLTAREAFDRRAGLLAAALGAVAPMAVWYSQEARMYGFFMLFATVGVLAQLRILRRGRRRDWALYVLATALLIWTQYFAVLLVGVQQVAFLLAAHGRRKRGEPWKPLLAGWAFSVLAMAILLAPLAPFALHQFDANQASGRGLQKPSQAGASVDGGRGAPGVYVAITNGVWAVWGYHSASTMGRITALWPLGMLVSLALLGRGRSRRVLLLVACAVVPGVGLFLIGEIKPFLFEIRYFSAAVPLLLILIAGAASGWARSRLAAGIAALVLVASLGLGLVDQQLNRSNPRLYDFKGALHRIESQARPGDVLLYQPQYLNDLVRYYAPTLHSRPLASGVPHTRRHARVFVMASFLDIPSEAKGATQGLNALQRHHRLVKQFRRPQVKVWVFSR